MCLKHKVGVTHYKKPQSASDASYTRSYFVWSSHYTSTHTVQYTPMAPHTRLLSNNNDSDLLEISGIWTTSGKEYSTHSGWLKKAHMHKKHPQTTSREGIKHSFALEEIRGVSISPLDLSEVPCHYTPEMEAQSIGIQLHRYLRKQSLLNILTAVCSVSRGHVLYTGGLRIDKENCKFVLPATCAL